MYTIKKLLSFVVFFALLMGGQSYAQTTIDPSALDNAYDAAKRLQTKKNATFQNFRIEEEDAGAAFAEEENLCFIPSDQSYIPVSRNDDGSYGPISLPFAYNLYGTDYNQVYINTNGNITFTGAYSEYNASGFPIGVPMVAAFWADIDTRNTAAGQIRYKVTSTYMVVTWDSVGYYNSQVDKKNTFQLIISNGADPLIGVGNNTAFYYKDMQWTTGSASNGSGGFGGTPATVGINKGNGVNYVQIGRFNTNTSVYDGPGASFDGINYLDNQCFPFNVTTTQNIPPSVSGLLNGSVFTIDVGDTLNLSPQFIGPEVGQSVTTIVNKGNFCNTKDSITNGAISKVEMQIVGSICNIGSHAITFTATDNGTPIQATTINVSVTVNKLSQTISFAVPPTIQANTTLALTGTSSAGLPLSYAVISGPAYISGNRLYQTGTGLVTIRASQSGNTTYAEATPIEVTICIAPSQPSVITGSKEVCHNTQASYTVANLTGADFIWSIDGGGTITSSGNTATVQWTTLGTHTVSVKYTNDCDTVGVPRTAIVEVVNKTVSGAFTKMLPSDGNSNLALPINFSWFPIVNAVSYDIYIWPELGVKPATPTIGNITGINYTLTSSNLLEFGQLYKWQIVAKSVCDQLESPIQTFRLRHLPDVVVNSIQVPASGFSGQSVSIRWEVKNIGIGGSLSQQWVDRVYLSKDQLLDDLDISLGTTDNLSELSPNTSYVRTASFTLPQGINDNFYVFVTTDAYNQLLEKDNSNNTTSSGATIAIQLTPPPDLQVTSILPPNFAFSGQSMNLTWKVSNLGTGPSVATSWNDNVYFSKESTFNLGTATRLGTFGHSGALPVGGNYTQTKTFTLPEGIFGPYYFYIVTDVFNDVYEHAFENNNRGRSDSMNVILTPPADLVVTHITIPPTASNGETVTIAWNVENNGGSPANSGWVDNIYLSKTPVFNADSAKLLGSAGRPVSLAPGENYDNQRSVKIPTGVTGEYYIYVKTDAAGNVYEYTFESNNTVRSSQKMTVVTPDLVVSSVSVPVRDTSGKSIHVSWTVKNNGLGKLFASTSTDRILISASPTFNPASSTELKQVTYNTGELATGETITKQASVKLPNGISGNYYLYVQTNHLHTVYESTHLNNTDRSGSPIAVVLAPWSDLQVSNIQHATDSATAGEVMPLSFTVVNKKTRTVTDSFWVDKIYISSRSVWNLAKSTLVRELVQTRHVPKDSSYTVSTNAKLPTHLGDSTYYFYVFTDATDTVYEHTDEGNNIRRGTPFYIKKYPPVDLALTAFSAPDTGSSGNPIKVEWKVENKGESATLQNQWTDAFYLSNDTVLDGADRLVKEVVHKGSLDKNESYLDQHTFALPNGVSGNLYLIAVTDKQDVNKDKDRGNNNRLKRAIQNGQSVPKPIAIKLTNPANLMVNVLNTPDQGIAGQPITIKWKVKNAGTGVTNANAWTEKVFLSTDFQLDGNDPVIASYVRAQPLSPGQEYGDSIQAFLPIEAIGNHVLIFKTDANDNVYEHGAEENTALGLITITQAPLSDLIVSSVPVPATAMAGEQITLQWKVKNIGANPAGGQMREGVYLSEDTLKDPNDIFLSSLSRSINIPPQGEVTHSFTGELKGVSLRDYHVLIHTDVLNNISETSDSNNTKASLQKMAVTVPELVIHAPVERTLPKNKEVYYRIEVPSSLNGESLLISLKGDSVKGSNEIYLRYNEMPTRAVYDYSHSQPYSGNQEIVVPELKTGTYYLMVYGSSTATLHQPITLQASILQFELRKVEAAKGGNTGQVTLLIQGSKLGTVSKIGLRNNKGTTDADSIRKVDPTKVFATFNLKGLPVGVYDVVAQTANGDTTSKKAGFQIVSGSAANLVVNVVTPPSTRPSNTISLTVEYTNAGNTDLINPTLQLSSLGGAPIAFSISELANNTKVLTLSLQEVNGPIGILRPGASGTIIVYAKAITALGFMLVQPEE